MFRPVFAFGLLSAALVLAARVVEDGLGVRLGLQVATAELAGAALGLLLVISLDFIGVEFQ